MTKDKEMPPLVKQKGLRQVIPPRQPKFVNGPLSRDEAGNDVNSTPYFKNSGQLDSHFAAVIEHGKNKSRQGSSGRASPQMSVSPKGLVSPNLNLRTFKYKF